MAPSLVEHHSGKDKVLLGLRLRALQKSLEENQAQLDKTQERADEKDRAIEELKQTNEKKDRVMEEMIKQNNELRQQLAAKQDEKYELLRQEVLKENKATRDEMKKQTEVIMSSQGSRLSNAIVVPRKGQGEVNSSS